jgi:hypothetical protein
MDVVGERGKAAVLGGLTAVRDQVKVSLEAQFTPTYSTWLLFLAVQDSATYPLHW